MRALELVARWPVDHAAAAVITPAGTVRTGDERTRFRLASLTKPVVAWAVMVGVEEGIVALDDPVAPAIGPPGATLRHLLSHAAGFGFDGEQPVAAVGQRRIYSNTGIERAAALLAEAAGMPFDQYLHDAVLAPLGMDAELRGSPAHGLFGTLDDVVRFLAEMRRPVLLAASTWEDVVRPQFPDLAGIVPGVGRFDPNPWGLGVEVRGAKSPHWTGRGNSPRTFGHFGGSGTMMWVDPDADVALAALTDRRFDDWPDEALQRWAELSDAVLAESAGGIGG
jgi:CubicO group peptidase (beta-lactamase class C family)